MKSGAASSYPRRQQARRLARAIQTGGLALVAALLAASMFAGGTAMPAIGLLVLAGALGAGSRRWAALARRSAVGARSEERVRSHLEALERDGWRVMHSLRWPGGGDIDHLAIAPRHLGLAFAIETKTRRHDRRQLARARAVARWVGRRRRGWAPRGAVAVLCLAGGRGIERWERCWWCRLSGWCRRYASAHTDGSGTSSPERCSAEATTCW
jgi:hypothetical protein